VLGRQPETGRDQQRAKLVAVQPDGMRLVVQAWPPDMGGRRMVQQVFLHRIPVEPGDGAQPPGDSGPSASASFQVTCEWAAPCFPDT
jgi:hypothetical protein